MSRPLGVALLLAIAVSFGSNHVAARLAFDHGTSVPTAVVVRSVFTALAVYLLVRAAGVSLAMPAATRRRAIAIGLMLTVQSYCLYAAVARIPVALALLAFNTYPLVFALMSWALVGERPARRTLAMMPVVLVGLFLALDVAGRIAALPADGASSGFVRRWAEIGAGVAFALAASVAFAASLLGTTRWLGGVDGRLRTLMTMPVIAIVTVVATLAAPALGGATSGFALPHDATGWTGLALLCVLYGSAITGVFVVLPRLGAVNNAAILNFEPIAALGIAWAVLGQTVAPLQLVGALIVVSGIAVLSLPPRAARRRAGGS